MTTRWLAALCCAVTLFVYATPADADEALVGSLSTIDLSTMNDEGKLERFGTGMALTLMFVELSGDIPSGVEGSAMFIDGPNGERLYDLSITIIGSTKLRDETIAPLISFGLDMAAVSFVEDGARQRGMSVGVHGNLGLHGFLSKTIYWRGQVGYLGAGVSAIKGELSLGYRFD